MSSVFEFKMWFLSSSEVFRTVISGGTCPAETRFWSFCFFCFLWIFSARIKILSCVVDADRIGETEFDIFLLHIRRDYHFIEIKKRVWHQGIVWIIFLSWYMQIVLTFSTIKVNLVDITVFLFGNLHSSLLFLDALRGKMKSDEDKNRDTIISIMYVILWVWITKSSIAKYVRIYAD